MANVVIRNHGQRGASITALLAALAAAVAFATLLPSPLTQLGRLRSAVPRGDRWQQLDELVLAAAGLASWALLGWFGLVAMLTLLARTTGPRGRIAGLLLRALAPPALRTVLATAVGLGSVAALTGCAPGTPASSPRSVTTVAELLADPSSTLSIDWPSAAPALPTQADAPITTIQTTAAASEPPTTLPRSAEIELNWPQAQTATPGVTTSAAADPTSPATPDPAPTSPRPATTPNTPTATPAPDGPAPVDAAPVTAPAQQSTSVDGSTGLVVVTLGDTLWAIAADRLPVGATDAEIAAAWPEWYAANRAVIGDDPDLILPGWQLTTPTPDGDESR